MLDHLYCKILYLTGVILSLLLKVVSLLLILYFRFIWTFHLTCWIVYALNIIVVKLINNTYISFGGTLARDHMMVRFATIYSMSAYHWCCEFKTRLGRGVHHYVIHFVSDLRQVGGFPEVLRFPPALKLIDTK